MSDTLQNLAFLVFGLSAGIAIRWMLRREREINEMDERVRRHKDKLSKADALRRTAPEILAGFRGAPTSAESVLGRATRTVQRSDGTWNLTYRHSGTQESLLVIHSETGALLVAIFHRHVFQRFGDADHFPEAAIPDDATAPLAQEIAEELRDQLARDLETA